MSWSEQELQKEESVSVPLRSRESTPEDYEAIAAHLVAALDLKPGDKVVDRSLCDWKYWQPHPFWPGSRSRVLLQDGRIVAHSSAWPIKLQGEFGTVTCLRTLDWAGSRDVRGVIGNG